MELIESLRTDVANLYQRVTGQSFPSDRFSRQPVPLPPHVEPIGYLRQELSHLTTLLDQRLAPQDLPTQSWVPVADAFDGPENYTVRVELPGVTKQDIDLAVGENVLRIQGERKIDVPPEGQVLSSERVHGAFERWLTFPFQIERSSMNVHFENGVLEIRVPKHVGEAKTFENVPIP